MTIVKPRKSNIGAINVLTPALMAVLLVIAVLGMFLYNSLVNLRHEVSRMNGEISKAEVQNAELKNALYKITDAKNLEELAKNRSLTLDKNPEYVRIEAAVAAN